jgi:hypothetical protein
LTERANHVISHFGIFVNQRGDGVEGIEQEMRLKLHFQSLEIGLSQARF